MWRFFGEYILADDSEKPRKPAYRDDKDSEGRTEGAQHSGRSGSRSNDYKPRDGQSGGYRPREGGQGGYRPREGGQGGQGGYRPREGGQSGGYRPREGGPSGQTGGFKPREGTAPAAGDSFRQPTDEERGLGKDTGGEGGFRAPRRSDDYTRSYRGTSARATSGQRAKGPNSNRKGKPVSKEAVHKQPMLSMHKIQPFKYDMNEILNETSLDPAKANAFLATVVAKASRISLKEAKEYINEVAEQGDITKDEQLRFNNLLQKYSKYR